MTPPNTTAAPRQTIAQKLTDSLVASAGNIVFGMEDGTVSIFGLVFGVAASAPSSHAALLAGATGAAAAAVSTMAGTYLDVSTATGRAQAKQGRLRSEISQHTSQEAQSVEARLTAAGFTEAERTAVVGALKAHPSTWLEIASASRQWLGCNARTQSPPDFGAPVGATEELRD